MKAHLLPECAECAAKKRVCALPEGGAPGSCPTISHTVAIDSAVAEYADPDTKEFARMASIQEGECYINRHDQPYVRHPVKPRVQEIVEFAKKMGYRKVGIAFCSGLHGEARALSAILHAQGFQVASVACKVGRIPKEQITSCG